MAAPEEGEAMTIDNRVFEIRNSYVLVSITTSEPMNPQIDPRVMPKASEIAHKADKIIPKEFPTVQDAVTDFRNSVYGIMQNTVIEYTAMFQGEEESSNNNQTGTQINPVVTS
jgi:hypothetical protein